MQNVADLFADYGSHHRTRGNKWFHRFGIPLIMLTSLGMLARVTLVEVNGWRIDAAMVLMLATGVYYLALEWKLGIAMIAMSIAFYFVGAAIPMWLNVAGFVVGWIFQFIGHSVYEKNRPAFMKNLQHLLIGPLWILNDLIPVVRPREVTH